MTDFLIWRACALYSRRGKRRLFKVTGGPLRVQVSSDDFHGDIGGCPSLRSGRLSQRYGKGLTIPGQKFFREQGAGCP